MSTEELLAAAESIINEIAIMRDAQRNYFKARVRNLSQTAKLLSAAKKQETKVDQLIDEYRQMNQTKLWQDHD